MPKKIMKIPSIFKNKEAKQQWQHWPLCIHPKTLSFRASNETSFTAILSIDTPPELLLADSLQCVGDHENEYYSSEVVISEVRLSSSERLFFEPNETSSIIKEAKGITNSNNHHMHGMFVFKDSVALEMESDDPYLDFKKSMQEMVESTTDQSSNNLLLKDNWDYLEELLGWYLRLNVKMNHGFIVGAFVDLLIGLAHASTSANSSSEIKSKTMLSCSDSTSYSSASSSFSSPDSALPSQILDMEVGTVEEISTSGHIYN